jgi:hypothetical protein
MSALTVEDGCGVRGVRIHVRVVMHGSVETYVCNATDMRGSCVVTLHAVAFLMSISR